MIVQFMDAQNLDIRSLKKSCIHFAQASKDGKKRQMIPFESYNIFYRDDRQEKLAEIRENLAESFNKRKGVQVTKLEDKAKNKLDEIKVLEVV